MIVKEKDLVSEPIFLVGAERSGTTVLRLMLSHHPQIAWCNEFEYTVDRIPDGDDWPHLEDYYQWLETHRIFQATGFTIDRRLSYPQLVNSFLLQKQNQESKSLIGATVHRHFDKLLRIWSDARFIHIVRDGRDVARSCIGMGWAGNVWTGVEGWIEVEQLWTQLKDMIPGERRTEVNYETLISEPTKTLTRLCEFIDVPYDEAMLSYAQNTTFDLPDPKLIQQWRRKLSEDEIQLVESRIADRLVERGYELSGLPPLEVTPARARSLRFQDWYARVKFRVKRQGLPLFLAEYFSRKLEIKQWHKRVKLKLNAIEKRYLK